MSKKNTAAAVDTAADTAPAAAQPANDNASSGSALALAPGQDALAALDIGADVLADDGLAEAGKEDRKLTILMINFGGMGRDGRAVPKDTYFNTVTETTKDVVQAVFISLHKTRVWSTFDTAANRTIVHCRSFDQVQGAMADGTLRPCEGCPDWKWYEKTDETGKVRKMRNCASVYNVASVDAESQQPFLIRFKKTSLPAFKTHLQRFHLDRRPLGAGRMGNYPLYVFGAKLTAKMASANAKHAIPIVEHTGILTREEIIAYAETAKILAGEIRAMIERADTIESGDDGGAVDTSFDTSKYVDSAGDDFVKPGAQSGQ